MSKRKALEAGDFITIDLDPTAGHEQGGWRRALVVSETRFIARVGLALICPVTTQVKGYPFEVAIPEGGNVHGVVLVDQLRTVDPSARNAKFVEKAPIEVLETARAYIALLIGAN